jgi:type I restriction enzyme M protein
MFEQAFRNIDDALRKEAGCTTELDYTEQTSWLLFLRYLDGLEQDRTTEAALAGKKYSYILEEPYRWDSWAAPKTAGGKIDHNKAMIGDDLRDFGNSWRQVVEAHPEVRSHRDSRVKLSSATIRRAVADAKA